MIIVEFYQVLLSDFYLLQTTLIWIAWLRILYSRDNFCRLFNCHCFYINYT